MLSQSKGQIKKKRSHKKKNLKEWLQWAHKKEIILFKTSKDRILEYKIWVTALAIVSVLYLFLFFFLTYKTSLYLDFLLPNLIFNEEKTDQCLYERALDGLCVDNEDQVQSPIFGVMIENHSTARPLAGVQEASLVYEALVEGSITRFLALFSSQTSVDKIGPVRSARPYFVEWAHEYHALYAHVGGSPEGLNLIKKRDIYNFDEYSKGAYFWRDNNRSAPHNAYTSSELLQKGDQDYYDNKVDVLAAWKFKDDADVDTRQPMNDYIEIPYSHGYYNVKWKYHHDDNLYYRHDDDTEAYQDINGNQVTTKNIIIMFVPTQVVDNVGRRSMDLIGSGKARAYRDGKVFDLTWKKESVDDRTIFVNEYDKQFTFNRGKTWVHVVPDYIEI